MIKKYLITSFLITVFSISSHAAGTDGGSSKVKSEYDKAVSLIKQAKKYEKKGKTEKANKRYEKAQKLLISSNKKVAKIAKKILKTKAPITPQRIICFLFFGTKFDAIDPTITALSAVNIIVIKIILVKIMSSSIKITL